MIAVRLSPYEMLMAAYVGARRQIEALRKGLQDQYPAEDDQHRWQTHIEGACGEMATAKALGIYWDGSINTFKAPDLVGKIQVRTRSQAHFDLIVRPDAQENDVYILVTGRAPAYQIRGWIKAVDAKQQQWLANYGGRGEAYFVPASSLKDIVKLKGIAQ